MWGELNEVAEWENKKEKERRAVSYTLGRIWARY
jgi:hypothetical protein